MTTTNEKRANEIDRDVYRLAEWAQRESDTLGLRTERGKRWSIVAQHLREADAALWQLMSQSDRDRLNGEAL